MSPADQMTAVRVGFEAADAEKMAIYYRLHLPDLATMLSLTPRTLQHHAKQSRRLDSVASERLLRLARVASHATAIFGDSISAGGWLMRPHLSLLEATPLSMLDTAYGEQEVERILCSIEYGLLV
ncbi:DUF2384 domain-containing protein [Deefgea tanakiae]|uniref:DUF2384 domain-containing protein n=1 Tax=Deefgea tanakiae TaxID=2865840 RepID=A0ABX8Z4H9_9NEIS|nr:antitoxin Xre/MbcA/ParS toxin-binding domain-containing protein [Deefgea tanakiae]QZA77482.1 DUF2384 domain-containing protein [Deefgea tanakiae]